MARLFSIVFLALALAITVSYRESFFGTACYEEGDDAANALQIYRAKHLQELHGNYSRWGFHHPGPAFFYVYAAGEWLLHDLTHIAPAPRNAHLYTGTLLQLAFYAAAIALVARHSRQPLLTIALALLAGAAHYAHVDRVLYSVWPPDVLLMPFLCFVVACAAVAIGDRVALPLMVLAGGFLVHGHIAQPLFVGPMSVVALVCAWRRWRGALRDVARSGSGIAAFVLLAIFLLPLALDLLAGSRSNAHDVLLHLRYETNARQGLWQSVLCYASYFVGVTDQTIFNVITPASYAPFKNHLGLLLGWSALLGGAAFVLCRRTRQTDVPDDIRFGRRLLAFWLVAGALNLVWGMRQDGGFTSFNSQFNHSLVHVLALIAIIALLHILPSATRLVAWAGVAAAVPAFALSVPFEPAVGSRGDELTVRLHALLLADPKPAAPKLITFAADEFHWYEAVTLGRALQRLGIEFYVHPTWRVMFGDDKVFANQHDILNRGGVSVWRILLKNEAPAGAHVLNSVCSVVFPAAAPLEGPPARIAFSADGNSARYTLFGVSVPEGDMAWTDSRVTAITFTAPATAKPLELTLEASGFVTPATPAGQRLRLFVNGELLIKETLNAERHRLRANVPVEVWNRRSPLTIVLELPDAIAPATAGDSGDRRLLGLRLYELTLAPANP